MGTSAYSTTPASNTTISGISIGEGCAPAGINDAIRQMMADIAADLVPLIGVSNGIPIIAAGGTADAITATFSPAITLSDLKVVAVRAGYANATTTPTFTPNALTTHTITKNGGGALVAGDIPAVNAIILLQYDLANTRWELLNPVFNSVLGANVSGNIAGTSANVSGTVAVANGGTGATTLTANNVVLGNGTSAVAFVAPSTSGNVLKSNGTTWTSAAPNAAGIFTVSYVSTAQTLSVAGSLTLAHSLGMAPKIIQLEVECSADDLGYSTGDRVVVSAKSGFCISRCSLKVERVSFNFSPNSLCAASELEV